MRKVSIFVLVRTLGVLYNGMVQVESYRLESGRSVMGYGLPTAKYRSGGARVEGKAAEFDPPGDETLDVEDVQAFVQPVYEERLRSTSMGADLRTVSSLSARSSRPSTSPLTEAPRASV